MRLAILLLFIHIHVFGQGLQLQQRINGRFDAMTTDHIGQIYLTIGGELLLYNIKGEKLYQYSDLSYGRIGSVDTRNPMKVQVFYPDFSRIVFLDNTLSKNREQSLRLDRIQLNLVQLVCTSFDNGFWVYDPVNFRLLRFDQHMNVTNSIDNVNQLVGTELDPTIMVEANDWLYINDPELGIFRFDVFGTYSKMIPVKGVTGLQVRDKDLLLTRPSGFSTFDLLTFEEFAMTLPTSGFSSVSIEKERLYILDSTGVSVYLFTDYRK
jgi:hypothetical protein